MKKIILFFGYTLFFISLKSQTNVGSEEVTVVKEFETQLLDADRVTIAPVIPDFEVKKPPMEYSIAQKEYRKFSFEPNALKPLAIAKEKIEKFNTSYIKLGFGSQLTPLAQFAYNDNRSEKVKFGLWYDHLSQYGFNIKNQRFTEDALGAYVRYFPKTIEIGAGFNFKNLRNHFYGLFPDSITEAKQLRQVFRTYEGSVWLQDAQKNEVDLRFNQLFTFNYFTEKTAKVSEWFVKSSTEIDKPIKKVHHLTAKLLADISMYKGDTISVVQRNLFQVGVGYVFNNDDWKARIAFAAGVDGKNFIPLPDLMIEKKVYKNIFIPYAGFKMELRKNSFRSFAVENNFLHSEQILRNTTTLSPYVGIKGNYEVFDYNVAFTYNRINDMAFFINDTLNMKRFQVVYDSVNNFNIRGEMGLNFKEKFRIGINAEYNLYEMKHLAKAWHTPALRVALKARYNWENKIIAGLELFGVTNTYALLSGGQEKMLKGTGDLNISLEYVFRKYLSFFGNLNNIAHQKYERYYGYPSFGINGVVGAKFSW